MVDDEPAPLATIAHDLNNLLARISGAVILATRNAGAPDAVAVQWERINQAVDEAVPLVARLAELGDGQAKQRSPTTRPSVGESVARPLLLMMGDGAEIAEVLRTALHGVGFAVALAQDGAEAVHAYRTAHKSGTPFVAVILDLSLRDGSDGAETVTQILGIDPEAKVIASVGSSPESVDASVEGRGFCAVLSEPLTLSGLREVLATVVD